jgi:hypothetical protein
MFTYPTKALIVSILGTLMNKVKFSLASARKNKGLGQKLGPVIALMAEQLLPAHIASNRAD